MVAAGRRGDSSHRSCSAVTLTWACASVLVTLSTLLLLLTFRPQDDASWLDTFGPSLAFIPGISLRAETRNHPHPPDLSNEQRPKEKFDAFRHDPSNTSNTIQKYAAVDAKGVLNIHVVPHTHDDVGWKKTVEQYFYGWNMSIDLRGHVQSIITTSLESVLQNPARTFTYVESKFFSMWWNLASDAQKRSMHYVIDGSKQWTFVNGGWSMHDEACTHYMGMIDQTTTGHSFLQRHLGVIPKVAWQLDPFGHSATQASLMTHKMGMNAIYFGRLDYEDLELRKNEQRCEGLWNPTTPGNTTVDPTIFFGLTGSYSGNYGPPGFKDFMFDELYCKKWGVTPLTLLNETELHNKLEYFLELMAKQASQTKTQDILLTMGTDFTFRQAESYFSNLDLLIHTIMLGQEWSLWNMTRIFEGLDIHRVNIFYSNPEYYTMRKYQQTKQAAAVEKWQQTQPAETSDAETNRQTATSLWTTKVDDFFPYSDRPHGFWSGFYTSRSAFKRFERVASGFLQAARQLDLLFDTKESVYDAESHPFYELEDALGVVQHHDSITGTGKEHVARDYSRRVQAGIDKATPHVLSIILNQMFPNRTLKSAIDLQNSGLQERLEETLQYCPLLLNESICEAATNTVFEGGKENMYVVVYNPLYQQSLQPRTWVVRVPVSMPGIYSVERVDDDIILSRDQTGNNKQLVHARVVNARNDNYTTHENNTIWQVEFLAGPLLPLGAVTYRVALQQPLGETESLNEDDEILPNNFIEISESTLSVSNGLGMIASFDRSTGEMDRVLSQTKIFGGAYSDEVDLRLELQWGYYTPFNSEHDTIPGDDYGQSSGAYVFRPSMPNQPLNVLPTCKSGKDSTRFVPTPLGLEVHTFYGHDDECWVHQIVRVTQDQPWIEVEYTVGPVPIKDGRGKEVVSRFLTPDIANNGVFFTDSNARAFLKRQRDYRPSWNLTTVHEPIAGNYYPVTAAIFLQDENTSFAVLTDRARGGSSIVDGTLEVKVQRRTLVDDRHGVGEPLNETVGGMTPYPPFGDATRMGRGVIVSGVHRLMVGGGNTGAQLARSAMDGIFAQPLIFVGSAPSDLNHTNVTDTTLEDEEATTFQPSFTVLSDTPKLPPNIFLVTLMRLYDFQKPNSNNQSSSASGSQSLLLIRLGHQYNVGEDNDNVLSTPVEINFQTMLDPDLYKVLSVTEKTLSGNQNWTDFVATKYNWTDPILERASSFYPSEWIDSADGVTVTLKPLDIRTFHVWVEKQ